MIRVRVLDFKLTGNEKTKGTLSARRERTD